VHHSQDTFAETQSFRNLKAKITYQPPHANIYEFEGIYYSDSISEPLSLENTLWANTVLTSGHIIGIVLFTGSHTRMAMNTRQPRSKSGIFDSEINFLSKLLFALMLVLAFMLQFFKGF